MDQFLATPRAIVDDLLAAHAQLAPLELSRPGSGARIVLQADRDPRRVAVLSGGGSGHEPSHAGFVGAGMLSGAVAGDLFASPGVAAVLAAIRACRDAPGVLLIIKNYTGDRLNFGLAAERARAEGIAVASVLVADDVALPEATQPRGLAGTVLVHKLAGYLAGQGVGLEALAERVQDFADQLLSLGMALSSATVPGQSLARRSSELGLGIHNEPGVRKVDPADIEQALDMVLTPLLAQADDRFGEDHPLVVLLNDLGGCSTQEMGTLTRHLLRRIGPGRIAVMPRPAALMTSMDMHGFSVSLAPASDEVITAMRAPVDTLAWPGVVTPHPPRLFDPALDRSELTPGGGRRDAGRGEAIERVVRSLADAREALDALDARTGDGDAGSTFSAGAEAVREALRDDRLSTGEDAILARELAALIEQSMGGSSGVLLSILFTTAATALEQGSSWPAAWTAGIARMQHYGGARLGDRTMLDALIPAVQALTDDRPAQAAQAAREGAERTAGMDQARSGRSAAVPSEALAGVVDPGAEAVARAFAAWAS